MTPALQIGGLRKAFGGLPATDNVSLEVMPGERRLIIGPNGAGKTTLFNLVTGDLSPDAGTIALFGEEVSRLGPHRRAHRGLARTYQIITLFSKDTLEHNIALSLTNSAEGLLGVIAGGSGTLAGPVVGAAIVVIMKNYVSAYIERWNMLLGFVFVAIVIFMPDGIVPGLRRLWARWRRRA